LIPLWNSFWEFQRTSYWPASWIRLLLLLLL
jgi:hypothetical protein